MNKQVASEVLHLLPTGWQHVKLEEIVVILDSQRVPVNSKERECRQGNVPYYGATGQVGWIDDFLFDEELVLLGEDGAPFFDVSKQKAYIIRGKSWVNNHAHVLRARAEMPSAYLKYFLDVVDYHGFVSGTTRAKLNQSEMRRIPVPVAPFDEQTRIVAEIEKQFSRLDEAVANLKRVKANLKRYKAAVLKAAVEGKLTEEWRRQHPNVEPADKLLERILAERRKAAGKGKYKEPVAPDTSGLPELPAGWVWASVEQLNPANRPCAYGVLQPGPDLDDGVLFIRVGDINDGCVIPDDIKRIDHKIAAAYPRTKLQGGEVLITLVGAIGRTAVVSEEFAGANTARAVGVIPLSGSVLPRWVEIWFRNPAKIHEMTGMAHEVARKTLNLEDVRSASVALPPLAEQHQIVAEVERRLSIVAEAEAEVDNNLRRADRLRQSILKQAFSGQLVPQDPNDEPASLLLERIRANVDVEARLAAPITKPANQKRARQASPLRKPEPVPVATNAFPSLDAVLSAILGRMQPGKEYSRADLVDPLGLSTGRWTAAIQELKRRGHVRQVGEKRGARYTLFTNTN